MSIFQSSFVGECLPVLLGDGKLTVFLFFIYPHTCDFQCMTPYLQLSTLFQFTTNRLLLIFTVDGIEVMHAHPHPLQTLYLHSLTFVVVMFLMWLQPTPELIL